MKEKISWGVITILPTLLLSGCAVGYNHTLFMTKSNFGVDIDTKPPTAEISFARREVVIEPSFEGGKTLPVFAAFKARNTVATSFFFGVDSMFAGGEAAIILATPKTQDQNGTQKQNSEDQPRDEEPAKKTQTSEENPCENKHGELCLSQQPRGETLWERFPNGKGEHVPIDGTVKPLFFATDTTLGLKVAWSGTTAQFPDSFKFGFNRKEFAFAPILGRKLKDNDFRVRMPSFLAGVNQSVTWQWFWALSDKREESQKSHINPAQFFATGEAAEKLASDNEIEKRKKAMLKSQDDTTP